MPLFCTTDFGDGSDYELANKLITYFINMQKTGESKGILLKKTALLESEHDYKLVRGLFALLERRSNFSSPSVVANPIIVRRKLFEESSARGLALSYSQRQEIVQLIANQMNLLPNQIETIMWNDREDNRIIAQFDPINPKDLILWYNLSLAQTLLFRCTGLEFYLKGGRHWKQVLRNVKRYGLMYHLEHNDSDSEDNDDSVKCIVEGPLSLFKMTDRYGTSMAKILPSIIDTPSWTINGSIIRKTDGGQKIYSFELSSTDTIGLFHSTSNTIYQNDEDEYAKKEKDYIYDSSVEAKFAKSFQQHFKNNNKLGWKISREPDPLIADGKAMIPDFLFERFGRKVYLEIVGFWTKEYLERKTQKLKTLLDIENKDNENKTNVDLLVAVNSELACSQIKEISKDRVFTFKKDVSIKPILGHLKKIDDEIVEEKIKTAQIKLDNNPDLISIEKVSQEYNVPEEAVLKILHIDYPEYVLSEKYLISKEKAHTIKDSLHRISKFIEACKVLTSNKIPECCHADLLSKLGYDVVWNDLDPNNATIIKK